MNDVINAETKQADIVVRSIIEMPDRATNMKKRDTTYCYYFVCKIKENKKREQKWEKEREKEREKR